MHDAHSLHPRILIVEEDGGVRRFLQVALSGQRFKIVAVANGVEALQMFCNRAHTFDLVLMDVQMPGIDGAKTLQQMQQVDPTVRCCFMTGDSSMSRCKELMQLGAKYVFSKPFLSVQDLLSKLNEVLAAPAGADPCSQSE